MRSLPKDGIEHRQYLRLKNVECEPQGISTAGRPPGEGGEDMPNLDFQPMLRELRSELAKFLSERVAKSANSDIGDTKASC